MGAWRNKRNKKKKQLVAIDHPPLLLGFKQWGGAGGGPQQGLAILQGHSRHVTGCCMGDVHDGNCNLIASSSADGR